MTLPHTPSGSALNPERVVKTVLFVDVVESVRLIEADETSAVTRWLQFAAKVENEVLPEYGGRLIKNLGDGLMFDFPSVKPAVAAAFAIQRACHDANAGIPPDRQMHHGYPGDRPAVVAEGAVHPTPNIPSKRGGSGYVPGIYPSRSSGDCPHHPSRRRGPLSRLRPIPW